MKTRVDDHQGEYLLKTKQAKPCILMYELSLLKVGFT
jgi:hypothetical protein